MSFASGRGAVRLARLHGVQEVGGSNPLAPTEDFTRWSLFVCNVIIFKSFLMQQLKQFFDIPQALCKIIMNQSETGSCQSRSLQD